MLLREENRSLLLKDILVVTQLPPLLDATLPYALALARHCRARTHFAHTAPEYWCQLLPNEKVNRRHLLAHSSTGNSSDSSGKLRHILERRDYDLVILSCRKPMAAQQPLGVLVHEVLETTDSPALILGPGVPRRELIPVEIARILYATDFSPQALAAAQHAFSWAQDYRASLKILHVVEGIGARTADERATLEVPFHKWMSELVPEELPLCCDLEKRVEFGVPAPAIINAARAIQADLVVIGLSGLDGVNPSSPGDTATRVIHQSPCPVLVIRECMQKPAQKIEWDERSASDIALLARR